MRWWALLLWMGMVAPTEVRAAGGPLPGPDPVPQAEAGRREVAGAPTRAATAPTGSKISKGKPQGAPCPEGCMGYRQTGGIAGMDVWFYVDGEGQVFRRVRTSPPARLARTLSSSELQALRRAFREHGFFSWPERSRDPVACDGMAYLVFYDDGKLRHQALIHAPGGAPQGFAELLKHLREVTQP